MTGTPPSAPNEPSGDTPAEGGGARYPKQSGSHQNPEPPPYSGGTEHGGTHGRHELPGLAGYPQFEGPGSAQYGSEAVEPPPPLPPQSGASQAPPGYPGASQTTQSGHAGAGQIPPGYAGGAPQSGYAGGAVPQSGYAPGGPGQPGPPQGPPSGVPPQGGFPTSGAEAPQTFEPPREHLDVGRALAYGWDRFRQNPIPWLGMVLIGLIAWLMVTLLVNILDVRSLSAVLMLFAVASLLVWLLQAAMIRGALYETDGTPPDFPAFFGFVNAGNVLITALLVFVACLIASMACVFPVVIVGVLCMFALHFVIDQDQDPLTAIKSSAQLVIANAIPVVLLALAVLIVTFVGALLCGVGLLVAGPVTAIAITYAYRTLTGRLVVRV
ncbi:hypothetical protein AB0N05_10170 [Nocardia sp. NPDC051030]|uniref:hypothetical protein n=1 Tax=Nocardia sp. NPDC051030 TaxID=3155162 RepID=UPI003418A4C0